MSGMQCLSCGAETTNGLGLCELCRRKVTADLDFLPVYFRNLARWRPGRAGSRQVPGSRVLYDGVVRGPGTGDRISDALDEVRTALTTWARTLVEDRPGFARPFTFADAVLSDDLPDYVADDLNDHPAQAVTLLCAGFEKHLTSIATIDWCGEFAHDLGRHEAKLRALTDSYVPGWYAGGCKGCGYATHVVPGLTWITCGYCGTTTSARDHLDTILDEATDWLAPPKLLAQAIVALVDTEESVPRLYDRIRWWASNGDIKPVHRIVRDYVWDDATNGLVVGDVQTGRARYRFGDVFARLADTAVTKVTRAG